MDGKKKTVWLAVGLSLLAMTAGLLLQWLGDPSGSAQTLFISGIAMLPASVIINRAGKGKR